MKIVLLNTTDIGGGAALACYRLFKALQSSGHDVKMIVRDFQRNESGIYPSRSGVFADKLNMLDFVWERLTFLPSEKDKSIRYNFSLANSGINILDHPYVKEADVIHLHWFNQGFLSIKAIKNLIDSGKKVVWTLHDMWAFTGGCHYSRGCSHYLHSCGECHFLKSPLTHDLSHKLWKGKKNLYQSSSIQFVTCSNWLANEAKQSGLLSDQHVQPIPNPIDVEMFKPLDKNETRNKLGLPEDKFLICFIAANIHDERKGVKYTLSSLEELYKNQLISKKMEVVIIGNTKGKLDVSNLPYKVHLPGFIRDEARIAAYYAACDVFVNTSLEDNLPNTIMESMACGTPCVAFNIGGIGDMIKHKENGILTDAENIMDISRSILEIYQNTELRQRYSNNAREFVCENFSYAPVVRQYLNVYQR